MPLSGFAIILFSGLLALAIIDLRTFRLPDAITLPLIILGLVFSIWQDHGGAPYNIAVNAGIGACIGYISFVGLEILYKHMRGVDGLGRGDAKLLAVGGAWCGWFGLPFIVLVASASGLIYIGFVHSIGRTQAKKSNIVTHIPFGPFLGLGIFFTWLALYILG